MARFTAAMRVFPPPDPGAERFRWLVGEDAAR